MTKSYGAKLLRRPIFPQTSKSNLVQPYMGSICSAAEKYYRIRRAFSSFISTLALPLPHTFSGHHMWPRKRTQKYYVQSVYKSFLTKLGDFYHFPTKCFLTAKNSFDPSIHIFWKTIFLGQLCPIIFFGKLLIYERGLNFNYCVRKAIICQEFYRNLTIHNFQDHGSPN